MDEPHFPQGIARLIQRIESSLIQTFSPTSLRLGGGSVLQARWDHRESTSIELFVEPQSYNAVMFDRRCQLEQSLLQLEGVDPSRSWVDANATYLECAGVEVSLLPVASVKKIRHDFVVPRTKIGTDYTSSILAQKLAYRMGGANIFEIRDLWDLYCATRYAESEFLDAVRFAGPRTSSSICALLSILSPNQLAKTDKPLVGVSEHVVERELISRVRDSIGKASLELDQ